MRPPSSQKPPAGMLQLNCAPDSQTSALMRGIVYESQLFEILMKKLFPGLLFASLTMLLFSAYPAFAQSSSELQGDWRFTVNQAPWEYSRGVITFEKSGDAWSGTILFHVNREVSVEEISIDGDEVRFELIVDGYDVRTVFTVQEEELAGIVYTIDGNMPFRANRVESEE